MRKWGLLALFFVVPGLHAQVKHTNTLKWQPSPTGSVTGYNVYRGITSGGPYTKLNTTPVTTTLYTDMDMTEGVRHYYVVTAVAGKQESDFSNEVSGVDVGTNVLPLGTNCTGTATLIAPNKWSFVVNCP